MRPGRGNVAAAEVGHHIDVAQFGQQRRVVALAGKTEFGTVADGLSMHAHQVHVGRRLAGLQQQLRHTVGVMHGQRIGGQGFAFDLVGAGGLQGHQVRAQMGGEGHVSRRQRGGDRLAIEGGQDPVDAVKTGAGHQADGQKGRIVHGRQVVKRKGRPLILQRRPGRGVRTAQSYLAAASFTSGAPGTRSMAMRCCMSAATVRKRCNCGPVRAWLLGTSTDSGLRGWLLTRNS